MDVALAGTSTLSSVKRRYSRLNGQWFVCVYLCMFTGPEGEGWRKGGHRTRRVQNPNQPRTSSAFTPHPPVPLLSAAERKKRWWGSTNDNKAAVYLTTHRRGVRRTGGLCWGNQTTVTTTIWKLYFCVLTGHINADDGQAFHKCVKIQMGLFL